MPPLLNRRKKLICHCTMWRMYLFPQFFQHNCERAAIKNRAWIRPYSDKSSPPFFGSVFFSPSFFIGGKNVVFYVPLLARKNSCPKTPFTFWLPLCAAATTKGFLISCNDHLRSPILIFFSLSSVPFFLSILPIPGEKNSDTGHWAQLTLCLFNGLSGLMEKTSIYTFAGS